MGQLVVHDLDDQVIESLKARAARQDPSLEAEARAILERAATERPADSTEARERAIAEFRERAERISRFLEGRPHSDSAALIREDRDR